MDNTMSQTRKNDKYKHPSTSELGLYAKPCDAISNQEVLLEQAKSLACFLEFKNENHENNFIQSLYFKLEENSGLFYIRKNDEDQKILDLVLIWNQNGKNKSDKLHITPTHLSDHDSLIEMIESKAPSISFFSPDENPAPIRKRKCAIL